MGQVSHATELDLALSIASVAMCGVFALLIWFAIHASRMNALLHDVLCGNREGIGADGKLVVLDPNDPAEAEILRGLGRHTERAMCDPDLPPELTKRVPR